MDIKVGTTWVPKRGSATFARKILKLIPNTANARYDRVHYREVMSDGDVGPLRDCYVSLLKTWAKKFGAQPANVRHAPAFVSDDAAPVEFFARDAGGQWHRVDGAGAWTPCESPV